MEILTCGDDGAMAANGVVGGDDGGCDVGDGDDDDYVCAFPFPLMLTWR